MIHPRKTVKSFGYATEGLRKAWREEHNFRFELLAAIIVMALGFFLNVPLSGMALLALACGMVLALELVNTMVELLSDMLKPRLDHYVQQIKDLTAAAVLVASVSAAVTGLYILVPAALQFSWQ